MSTKREESLPPSAGSSGPNENEETLWEGRYSIKNFLGRGVFGGLFLLAWIALALATWGFGHASLTFTSYATGIALVLFWLHFGYKVFRVRRNHYYRLTTRRLFLTTGFFQRRVDQVELIQVEDLFVQQSLLGSWLNVGTVTLISSEPTLPKAHLLGIEEPRRVLDLIWFHTRRERDRRPTQAKPLKTNRARTSHT